MPKAEGDLGRTSLAPDPIRSNTEAAPLCHCATSLPAGRGESKSGPWQGLLYTEMSGIEVRISVTRP